MLVSLLYFVGLGLALRDYAFMPGLLAVLLLLSLISVVLYARDKRAARLGRDRTPEKTLHLYALLGGWPGAWLAQQGLRHKTRKLPFRRIFLLTVVCNLLLLWLLLFSHWTDGGRGWLDGQVRVWQSALPARYNSLLTLAE